MDNKMDLTHSHTSEVSVVSDAYIPGSKSTDLIKPSPSGNLDNQQPPGKLLLWLKRRIYMGNCFVDSIRLFGLFFTVNLLLVGLAP